MQYDEAETPEEQSRRQFLAKATVAIGAVTGLVLAVPLATSDPLRAASILCRFASGRVKRR